MRNIVKFILLLGFICFSFQNSLSFAQQPAKSLIHPTQTNKALDKQDKLLAQQVVGDYQMDIVTSPADGWYQWQNGNLVWMPPAANTNVHIEVFLKDVQSQLILPDSQVTMSIYDKNNNLIASQPEIFLWHPLGYHYGNNWIIPCDDVYTIKIDATPPAFARHDKQLGARFSSPLSATFQNIRLKPEGQAS